MIQLVHHAGRKVVLLGVAAVAFIVGRKSNKNERELKERLEDIDAKLDDISSDLKKRNPDRK